MITLLVSILSLSTLSAPSTVGEYMSQQSLPAATCKIRMGKTGICSGTLISPTTVLTAGHCLRPPIKDMKISCGNTMSEKGLIQSVSSFDSMHFASDVMVLHVARPFTTKPMKLISKRSFSSFKASPNQFSCFAIGFGMSKFGFGVKTGVALTNVKVSQNDYALLQGMRLLDHLKRIKIEDFIKFMHEGSLMEIESEQDRLSRYKELLEEAIAPIIKSQRDFNFSLKANFTLSVTSSSSLYKHTSGIMPGDSGGTSACLDSSGDFVLTGINSAGLWNEEGTHFTTGYSAPLTEEILDFVLNTVRTKGESVNFGVLHQWPKLKDSAKIKQDNTRVKTLN